jgi:hypothetical protein
MGQVIIFAKPAVSHRRRKLVDRPCEVTIFPGVRYERHERIPDIARPDWNAAVSSRPYENEQA